MTKNDVLGLGAVSAIILTCCAWLTGYFDNRLISWLGLFAVISVSSGAAWFTKDKKADYQDIARYSAAFGAVVYVLATLLGLVATRWAHGTWSPELLSTTSGIFTKLFSEFPRYFMVNILHPTFSTVIGGALLMGIWSGLGASFLPLPSPKSNTKKKGKK